jgi:pyruvate dehydrogenase E1 component beta subunit
MSMDALLEASISPYERAADEQDANGSPLRLLSYSEALREAIEQEMQRDDRVFVMGQGVDDFKGMYGTTKGLAEQFGGQRVFDTPLSEDSMTGVAIGSA